MSVASIPQALGNLEKVQHFIRPIYNQEEAVSIEQAFDLAVTGATTVGVVMVIFNAFSKNALKKLWQLIQS